MRSRRHWEAAKAAAEAKIRIFLRLFGEERARKAEEATRGGHRKATKRLRVTNGTSADPPYYVVVTTTSHLQI